MPSQAGKPRVLMVGAFPLRSAKKIYGGQVAACMRLLDSAFVTDHAVRTLDSTLVSQPPPSLGVRLLYAVKRLCLFVWETVLYRPDVVILFLADGASACEKGVMVRIARLLHLRVMVFPRAGNLMRQYSANRLFAAFIRHTLGRADLFLCQGAAFQAFAIENLGFTQASAPVIPNWTALKTHLDIGENRAYGQDPACVKLLFLGWLEESKGVFDLLESVRMLHEKGISFHLTFAGDGTAMPEARRFVALHNLSSHVTFAGWVDDAAKNALLQSCDVFVLPSWNEGLPNAMIEAMSAGLACVLTQVGAISDYVTDGREALIVQPRQPVALAEALKRLVTTPSLRDTLGQGGHTLALTQFSLEQGARRMREAVITARHQEQS